MIHTVAFWFWFAVATASLGRLWSTFDRGGPFGAPDALALVGLLLSGFLLARVQYDTARSARK